MELLKPPACLQGMDDQNDRSYEVHLAGLFQPDELATYEYRRTAERRTFLEPEKRLLFAVLEDAILCFQRFINATSRRQKHLHQDAVAWIFETDDNRTLSFESVCDACGLDPEFLRMGLRKWSEENRSKRSPSSTAAKISRRWRQRSR
jgi:hypothetical protein